MTLNEYKFDFSSIYFKKNEDDILCMRIDLKNKGHDLHCLIDVKSCLNFIKNKEELDQLNMTLIASINSLTHSMRSALEDNTDQNIIDEINK